MSFVEEKWLDEGRVLLKFVEVCIEEVRWELCVVSWCESNIKIQLHIIVISTRILVNYF